jgi:hypothetical protein
MHKSRDFIEFSLPAVEMSPPFPTIKSAINLTPQGINNLLYIFLLPLTPL